MPDVVVISMLISFACHPPHFAVYALVVADGVPVLSAGAMVVFFCAALCACCWCLIAL